MRRPQLLTARQQLSRCRALRAVVTAGADTDARRTLTLRRRTCCSRPLRQVTADAVDRVGYLLLSADLHAAIDTRRDEPSEHPPWAPDGDEPYDPERQAQGYVQHVAADER